MLKGSCNAKCDNGGVCAATTGMGDVEPTCDVQGLRLLLCPLLLTGEKLPERARVTPNKGKGPVQTTSCSYRIEAAPSSDCTKGALAASWALASSHCSKSSGMSNSAACQVTDRRQRGSRG